MSAKDNIIVTVYGLSSSEDGKLRYIGQTTGQLNRRLIHHHYDAKKLGTIHKSNWIRSVIARGFEVLIFAIEENAPWGVAEIKWIKHYRDAGVDLVNTTDGGEGVVGYIRTLEQRLALGARMRGRTSPRKGAKLSDETKAKISAAQQFRGPVSDETRAKLSAAMKGRVKSPEHLAKIAAKNKARSKPPAPPLTEEQLADKKRLKFERLSILRKGRVLSDEHKAKIATGLTQAYGAGRRPPRAKLTDEQVREARRLLSLPGANQRQLAKQFGISEGSMSALKSGASYRHVT